MANETNKTQEILEFKVEQGGAIAELEKLRKTMVGLKEEQAQLSKAYKQGDITVEEYAKEITRVDTLLKKVSTSHNAQQKAMAGVQTETSKLIKSNQQLTQSLKDSASQINVAGVNVGQLGQKLASFANPVTASIALVGALGAAYARSTIGAKDLAFAQSQLSSAVTILTNDFAGLFASAEDGEGPISKITNRIIAQAGVLAGPLGLLASGYFEKVAADSREAALAQEQFDDLLRDEIAIRGQLSERLADNQELLTLINDEQTSFADKLANIEKIQKNIKDNRADLLGVLNDELFLLNEQLDKDQENEALQTKVLEKKREIDKLIADSAKKLEGVNRLEDNIRTQNERQAAAAKEKQKALEFQTSEIERQARIATLERQLAGNKSPIDQLREDTNQQVKIATDASKAMGKAAEDLADQVEESNKRQKKSNEGVADSTDAQRDALRLFSSEAARLYQTINKENRFFAAAQLAVDAGLTLSGIIKNAAALPPKQANLYRAAAILSATASLAQAAKLIGASSPGLGNIITSSSGEQFVVEDGKAIPLAEVQAKEARAAERSTTISTIGGAVATGAAIAGIPGAIGGALVGGLIVLGRRLFGRKKSSYATGGWTGPGDMYDIAGVVHADEYVAPKKVVNNPAAQPHLKALERLRGSYATGGYTGFGSTQNNMADMVRMLSGIKIFASITDINKAQKRQAVKMGIVTK